MPSDSTSPYSNLGSMRVYLLAIFQGNPKLSSKIIFLAFTDEVKSFPKPFRFSSKRFFSCSTLKIEILFFNKILSAFFTGIKRQL